MNIDRKDEIGQLALAFNTMLEELAAAGNGEHPSRPAPSRCKPNWNERPNSRRWAS